MVGRSISIVEVGEALANPSTTYRSSLDASRVVVLGTTGAGRRLKVVVSADNQLFVITVADRDDER